MAIYKPERKTLSGSEEVKFPISSVDGLESALSKFPRIYLPTINKDSTIADLITALRAEGITEEDYAYVVFGGSSDSSPPEPAIIRITDPFAGGSLCTIKLWFLFSTFVAVKDKTTGVTETISGATLYNSYVLHTDNKELYGAINEIHDSLASVATSGYINDLEVKENTEFFLDGGGSGLVATENAAGGVEVSFVDDSLRLNDVANAYGTAAYIY